MTQGQSMVESGARKGQSGKPKEKRQSSTWDWESFQAMDAGVSGSGKYARVLRELPENSTTVTH